jgi:hypothetical protein
MFLHDLRALCLRRTDQDLLRCLREAYLPLHMKLFFASSHLHMHSFGFIWSKSQHYRLAQLRDMPLQRSQL